MGPPASGWLRGRCRGLGPVRGSLGPGGSAADGDARPALLVACSALGLGLRLGLGLDSRGDGVRSAVGRAMADAYVPPAALLAA